MSKQGVISTKIVIEDPDKYNNQLKVIRSNLSEFRTELKTCTTEYKDTANTAQALAAKEEILSKQYEEAKKAVELYSQIIKEATPKLEEYRATQERLSKEYDEEKDKLETLKNSSNATTEEIKEQQEKVEILEKTLRGANNTYTQATVEMNKYESALNNAKTEEMQYGSELEKTRQYLEEANNSTDKCAKSIDEFGNETEEAKKEVNNFFKLIEANVISDFTVDALRGIADGIKDVAVAAVETGKEFNAAMGQVAATMGMTSEEIANGSERYQLLESAARKCGETTMFSASQSAEALNYLALAGYDAEKAAETLPKVLTLAAAGGMDLAYASDLVTDSMAALGMETYQLDSYIDQMTKTAQSSNTSVAQLGEASLVCAGAVSLAQQDIVTMNTELGILANNGIKGAEGGTHLRNIILSLSAPTDKAAGKLKELGVVIEDQVTGDMRNLNDIMIDLNNSLADMGSVEKAATIKSIFNKTDIAAVNALLKGSSEEYEVLSEKIRNSAGAADEMAKVLNDNLKGDITILNSALEALGIASEKVFDKELRKSVQNATDAVGKLTESVNNGKLNVSFTKMSEALGDFIDRATDGADVVLPALIDIFTWIIDNSGEITAGIGGIAASQLLFGQAIPFITAAQASWTAYQTATEGATIAQWLLNEAMTANPVGLLVTAIGGLVAGLGIYNLLVQDSADYTFEAVESTQKAIESFNDVKASSENLRTEFGTQQKYVEDLAAKIKDLNEKTSLTENEQKEMASAVNQLNAIYPEWNLQINDNTGHLTENSEALLTNIDDQLKYIQLQRAREEITELLEAQADAEYELYQAEQRLAEVKEELGLDEIQQQIDDLTEAYENGAVTVEQYDVRLDGLYRRYNEVAEANDELYMEQEQWQEKIETLSNETIPGLSDEIGSLTNYMDDVLEPAEANIEAANELAAAQDGLALATQYSEEAFESFEDLLKDANEHISGSIGLLSELGGESAKTFEEMKELWADDNEVLKQYNEDMAFLKELVESDVDPALKNLVESAVSLGIDGAPEVHELASALQEMNDSGEGFQEITDLWQERLDLMAEAEDMYAGVRVQDSEYTEETKELFAQYFEEQQTAREEYQIYVEGVAETHKENMTQITSDTVVDMSTAITTKTEENLKPAVQGMVQTTLDTTKTNLGITTESGRSDKFYSIGKDGICGGLAQGIKDGTSAVCDAIKALCEEAVASVDISGIVSAIDKKLGEAIGG
ncbi:MAG: phage tail tape measure protein [Butyrivibrio sp.]|uniref:phage tail tape measure protein n=1 Tax=Butyrivibrio sp. TaxID=28121 RepID=UPI001B6B59AA|nr:phage tail tape measure protein [Butyrivibrio sp.]MBP3784603.1 phage tail tape measure protein [Butyrivibrio sp.]